ncbi:hypothetical protein RRG08_036447 [Elysia crispata]|uniref:Uncharacterized protein n=1 Tax=Elysia crispata TaxID=231223 RepID=A0AAE0ZLV1_9GAST|nr:hypothetical protein RRG08_036447 [Elysia crispata]
MCPEANYVKSACSYITPIVQTKRSGARDHTSICFTFGNVMHCQEVNNMATACSINPTGPSHASRKHPDSPYTRASGSELRGQVYLESDCMASDSKVTSIPRDRPPVDRRGARTHQ